MTGYGAINRVTTECGVEKKMIEEITIKQSVSIITSSVLK